MLHKSGTVHIWPDIPVGSLFIFSVASCKSTSAEAPYIFLYSLALPKLMVLCMQLLSVALTDGCHACVPPKG